MLLICGACGNGGETPAPPITPQPPPEPTGTLVLVNQSVCSFFCVRARPSGSPTWAEACDYEDPLWSGSTDAGEWPVGTWDLEINDDIGEGPSCVFFFTVVREGEATVITIGP